MARKSDVKMVVERLTIPELREFLEHQGLAGSGRKPELVERLLRHHHRDLGELMSKGPWRLAEWKRMGQELVGHTQGNSYDDLAEFLAAIMSPEGSLAYGKAQEAAQDDEDDEDDDDGSWSERESSSGVTLCPCRSGKAFHECHGASAGRRSEPPHASSGGSGRPELHESEAWVLDVARLRWPPRLEQVRAARRELAMFFHPDKHAGHAAALEKMKFLNDGCDRLEARLAGSRGL